MRAVTLTVSFIGVVSFAAGGCDDSTGPEGPQVESIEGLPSQVDLVPQETIQLVGSPVDRDGVQQQAPITWASSDPTVVRTTPAGLLEGVATGSATITATAAGFIARVPVRVLGEAAREEALVLDPTAYRLLSDSVERASGLFRFRLSSAATVPSTGSIIVGTEGDGFLRRVSSSSLSGDVLSLQTAHATLDEAIKAGRLQANTVLSTGAGSLTVPEPRRDSQPQVSWGSPVVLSRAPGVSTTAAGLSLDDLTILRGEQCNASRSECGEVSMRITEGQIDFAPDFELDVLFGFGGVEEATVLTSGELIFQARAALSSEVSFDAAKSIGGEVTLATVKHPWFAVVGGVPVQGSVVFTLKAGVSLELTGALGLETGVAHTTKVLLGASYEAGRWQEITDVERQSTAFPPSWQASASAELKIFIKPEIKAFVYETVGPTASVEAYLAGVAEVDLNRWRLTSRFGLDLSVGVEAKVPVFDWELVALEKKWELAQYQLGEWSGENYALDVRPASLSLAIGQSRLLDVRGIRSDGSEVAVQGPLDWSSSNTSVATVSPLGLVMATGPGTATVTAKTSAGSTDASSITVLDVEASPSAALLGGRVTGTSDVCVDAELDVGLFDLNGASVQGIAAAGAISFANVLWGSGEAMNASVRSTSEATYPVSGPFSAAIVIDQSGSMSSNDPENVRLAAAEQFVGEAGPGDEFALYTFSSNVVRVTDLSSDQASFGAALGGLGSPNGGTALFDAVLRACYFLPTGANTNRAVVVMTDGADTQSSASLDQVTRACKDRGARVFAVGFGGAGADQLVRLATNTGGSVIQDPDVRILTSGVRALPSLIRGGQRGTRVRTRLCRTQGQVAEGGQVTGRVQVQLQPSAAPGASATAQSTGTSVSAPFSLRVLGAWQQVFSEDFEQPLSGWDRGDFVGPGGAYYVETRRVQQGGNTVLEMGGYTTTGNIPLSIRRDLQPPAGATAFAVEFDLQLDQCFPQDDASFLVSAYDPNGGEAMLVSWSNYTRIYRNWQNELPPLGPGWHRVRAEAHLADDETVLFVDGQEIGRAGLRQLGAPAPRRFGFQTTTRFTWGCRAWVDDVAVAYRGG